MRIDPGRFRCLGAALDAALLEWPDAVCLVESDRERENERLTYGEFRRRALPLASWLERAAGFAPGERAAIVMTNQSKWHLSAYAVLRCGGVLVPLDFKLDGREHLALLAHCRAKVLIAEHHLWRAMARAEGFGELAVEHVLVTEAPPGEELPEPGPWVSVQRWEDCRDESQPAPPLVPRGRNDVACIVYSSGTGGRAKGCLLTHGNYLDQYRSLSELHPFGPEVRYLSILPTNHAIDFMVGFLGPYLCGATVVHLRTLRPELVRDAFRRYRITHVALVPMVLRNLESALRERFAALPAPRRAMLRAGQALHAALGRGRPRPHIARRLLGPVHEGFGGALEAVFVGGAATDPDTLRFFHHLGIPVANGYGLTEAGTAVTLDRLDPPAPETVGKPLPGTEVRILEPDAEGVGEVAVRSGTVMAGYLDDPALTAETIVDGWLHTGDLGRLRPDGNLCLVGRRKNMIVTEGGKNVYPEDVESAFEGIAAKELCVFAAHYLWPDAAGDERLLLVARAEDGDVDALLREVAARNRRLRDFQRIRGVILRDEEFPRTASLKIKRPELAKRVAATCDRERDVFPLP